jgi:hypothetical protein
MVCARRVPAVCRRTGIPCFVFTIGPLYDRPVGILHSCGVLGRDTIGR